MILSEVDSRSIADKLLRLADDADQVEAVISSVETGLTRFANNGIHQNVSEDSVHVNLRAVVGQKVGVADGNQVDDESLGLLASKALAIARLQPENPEFAGLPSEGRRRTIEASSARTAPDKSWTRPGHGA